MTSLQSTWKAYLNPSAWPMDLEILKTNWLCLSPILIFWKIVSATVGPICGIVLYLMSAPLDLLINFSN